MADRYQANLSLHHFPEQEIPDLALGDQVQHRADLIRQQEFCPSPQRARQTEPL